MRLFTMMDFTESLRRRYFVRNKIICLLCSEYAHVGRSSGSNTYGVEDGLNQLFLMSRSGALLTVVLRFVYIPAFFRKANPVGRGLLLHEKLQYFYSHYIAVPYILLSSSLCIK